MGAWQNNRSVARSRSEQKLFQRFVQLNRRWRWLRSRCVDDIVRPGRSLRSIASHFFVPSCLEGKTYVDESNTMDLVDGFTLTLPGSKISIDSSCDFVANCLQDRLRDYSTRKRTKRNELGEYPSRIRTFRSVSNDFPIKGFSAKRRHSFASSSMLRMSFQNRPAFKAPLLPFSLLFFFRS